VADIYEKLRNRLDELSTGYPETESGIEIQILKRLFSQDEAELFIKLSILLDTPANIAAKHDLDPVDTAERLDQMADKGLLFRLRRGETVRYAAVPFVIGIYEYQVGSMSRETAEEMNTYFEAALGKTLQAGTPQMRSIPIDRKIAAEWPVAPYEDVVAIIESQKSIVIAPCICRKTKRLLDTGCEKPLETCFHFGAHGDYYVERGMGRYITKAKALEIVRHNDAAGLVMMPFNAQKVGGMCSCCGDCCGMLRSLKMQPSPAKAVRSNYYARVEEEECTGCETCLERCQMDAIDIQDDVAQVNLERCIGCGLCITTCPTDAMQFVKKPEAELYTSPATGGETYTNIAMERNRNPLANT
jgi:formate hydrogenlyase subunit 6/NADH:ubiquinone oxidoreductase subunit I